MLRSLLLFITVMLISVEGRSRSHGRARKAVGPGSGWCTCSIEYGGRNGRGLRDSGTRSVRGCDPGAGGGACGTQREAAKRSGLLFSKTVPEDWELESASQVCMHSMEGTHNLRSCLNSRMRNIEISLHALQSGFAVWLGRGHGRCLDFL